jgi:hypothetical protein
MRNRFAKHCLNIVLDKKDDRKNTLHRAKWHEHARQACHDETILIVRLSFRYFPASHRHVEKVKPQSIQQDAKMTKNTPTNPIGNGTSLSRNAKAAIPNPTSR